MAVFNVPQHGHVFPTLAVVEELVARGYRVSCAVTEEFEACVKDAGGTPVLYRAPSVEGSEAPEDLASGVTQAVTVSVESLPALASHFEGDRPDIVLYDVYAWAGPLLAERWQVPVVQLSPTHVPYEGIVQDLFGLPDISRIPGFPTLAHALDQAGLTTTVHALTLAPSRVIAFLPRSFQRSPETVTAGQCHFVGPALSARTFQGSWRRPQCGRKVVYISLGSQFTRRPDFYRACIQAFAGSDWHAVMTVGAGVSLSELGELPEHFEVHRSVPQLDVLRAASVFVTHGGMGSVMESLTYAVPMVGVPQMAEQRINVDQIERLGLGRHLPREQVDAQTLRQAVEEVAASTAIARALAQMGPALREAGGASAAADVVEETLLSARVANA
ncbi:macrolide family glycosyltransferase [Streptomyces roseus]|uniref:macrolide family glycosyltransferase n=1 Tax=Streptomyces roseus TaxID=66430 RepID=UPI0033FB1EC4